MSDHHLRGEEEGCGGDGVPVEAVEGVEHVEPLHVHDRRVDAQLGPANGGEGSNVNGIMISLLVYTHYRVAHLLRERIMLTAIRQLRMAGLEELYMH